jgi:hypothetical protein
MGGSRWVGGKKFKRKNKNKNWVGGGDGFHNIFFGIWKGIA